jgi:hypothetical protein
MSDMPRLGHAGLLAALLSLVAVSCGSDVVDLLPPMTGAGNGGGAGEAASAAAGASSGGVRNEAGRAATSQAGASGAAAGSGGKAGNAGAAGCSGFGCGNAGEGPSLGGAFGGPICNNGTSSCTPCLSDVQCASDQHCSRFLGNLCVQCAEKGQCKPGFTCDRLVGRCGPSCKSTFECNDGRVCDMTQGTCVTCIDNQQCESDGDPDTRVCYQRRCVQCQEDADCTQGARHRCAGLQCVECINDKDCPGNNGDNGHCDTAHAHCE